MSPEGVNHNGTEAEPRKNIEQLFGSNLLIETIEDGDEIGVGGSIFSDDLNYFLKVDSAPLQPYIDEIKGRIDGNSHEQLKPWLDSQKMNVEPKLFACLWSISATLSKLTSENVDRKQSRLNRYHNNSPDGTANLSQFLTENEAECAEIATFSQLAMQELGLKSYFMSGDLLGDLDEEFSESHSFNLVVDEESGQTFIFDPTNPVPVDWGDKYPSVLPTIFEAPESFIDDIRNAQDQLFMECKNIYGGKNWLYGVNNHTNVRNVISLNSPEAQDTNNTP